MSRKVGIYIISEAEKDGSGNYVRKARERYFGCPDSKDWEVKKTGRGKPFFSDRPKTGLSITHSGFFWGCAIGEGPVGLDIQKHVLRKTETVEEAAGRCEKLAKRFFHPEEAGLVSVEKTGAEECCRRFFWLWSAKESYVKYTGQGIDESFGAVSVLPKQKEKPLFTSPMKEEAYFWEGPKVWFCHMDLYPGYSLCLCTEEKETIELTFLKE